MATQRVPISMDEEDYNYLKEKGINRSEFYRQAVEAHRKGEFEYDKSKQR